MKIAIDAMGGDNAPKEIVLGINKAIKEFTDIEIILFGKEQEIQQYLEPNARVEIVHTDEKIEGTDEPVRAVRRKKNASMVLMAQAVAAGKADACISAGNTGALMAAGLFIVGRIDGIERPALAPTLPTVDGKGFVMLDLGANAEAKPEHLLQYAIMGSIYAQKVRGIEKPKVGLLNIGTEEKKGNELTKKAFELLKDSNLHFVGNIESRDLLQGPADVVVTDGFTGNMVLKTIEGTAGSLFSLLKKTFMTNFKSKIAAGLVKNELKDLKNMMDYTEYGGAGLFGLNSPVIKAHGSSNANALYNAIRQANDMASHKVTRIIKETIQKENEITKE
ncbi:phosphate acyltransferase [Heyndrickxia sporothermodurans]|uniref:Phosphate acyltransferase n=2 Tax=Heyndrickxia sporothermodurans TaxID=46224 RepID=A0AB37HPN8_9BACI|nr:phosphate acyltransferase PlsX [Heyndrickxia sporothermodurans]MBL5767916.1 phosphate acyltransferase PlsX [Heyndrickxia sporothermodurans]MBL5772562.1 phosphate acyltransferase PlsX [Heyndrickxia sporothermodurans]MBL5775189.1 phosphate acyltransferase PlsX [Heyndrickxia sporothermodurans]MBL5778629.1 phosphate acyltransferase PlsX [Heyndrickxia sporothermodurans]MBL5782218.1 phosphate acyltransferase PlsX [Heyndrickxia sporothermodurans]